MTTERAPIDKQYLCFRHGSVERRASDLIIGAGTDTELSADGIQQAHQLAEMISETMGRPEIIISSPLKRATQTAEIVAGKWNNPIPVWLDRRLQAQHFGALEGKTVTELAEDPELKKFLYKNVPVDEHSIIKPPGGESLIEVQNRVHGFLAWLKRTVDTPKVLIVTHGSVLRTMRGVVEDIEPAQWENITPIKHCDFLAVSADTVNTTYPKKKPGLT